MTRESRTELLTGAALLIAGIGLELVSPGSWPVFWIHGVVLQCAGVACLLDSIIRPHDPPSRVMIAGLVIGYALMLSP